jgi:undecaprenyl-diphosphatase
VVIGAVGGAVLANNAIRAVVDRPLTEAEIHAAPLLSTGHHPFPSGHVAGIGALLGIIAVCIAVGRSRTVQALLMILVVAGVVIVAFSRLYLGLHWLSDVIGGALLAGMAVILGTVALTTRSDGDAWPAPIGGGGQSSNCGQPPIAAPRTLAGGFRPTPLRKGTHDHRG